MCKFFSFISDPKGNVHYFNADERLKLLKSNPEEYNPDSHSSIVHKLVSIQGNVEDHCNKYELLQGEFIVDQINGKNDSEKMKRWVENFIKTDEFREVCLATVTENGYAVQFLTDEQKTPEVCLAAVGQGGHAVQYLTDEQRTPEVCLGAVAQSGCAVKYLTDEQLGYLK